MLKQLFYFLYLADRLCLTMIDTQSIPYNTHVSGPDGRGARFFLNVPNGWYSRHSLLRGDASPMSLR